jgi:hypothetical protein
LIAIGNWIGTYGADGYNVSQDASIKTPAYAQINLSNYANFLWAASSGSSNSLQRPENPSVRIAGTWYSRSSFFIDVNLTDGNTHQVSFYGLDYDSTVRAETITCETLRPTPFWTAELLSRAQTSTNWFGIYKGTSNTRSCHRRFECGDQRDIP